MGINTGSLGIDDNEGFETKKYNIDARNLNINAGSNLGIIIPGIFGSSILLTLQRIKYNFFYLYKLKFPKFPNEEPAAAAFNYLIFYTSKRILFVL